MSIRHRITLLIVLSVLAILTIGGYSIYQARLNAAEVREVTEGVVPSALATADLVSQVKEIQLVTMALITAPDATLAAQANEKLITGKAGVMQGIAFQLAHAAGKTQLGLVEQAKDKLTDYFSEIDETVKFKLAGQNDIAEATYYGNVVVLQRELQQVVDTLRIEKSREKDAAIAALNKNLSRTATGVSIVSMLVIATLAAFGIVLYRQIVSPISQMQATTSEIANSQDFTRRVPVRRMDEIGHSIVAFNMMIERIEENSLLLRQKNKDIQSMLQNMPQGILTICPGNLVHSEYSAYLEKIFDTTDIAGKDYLHLVFSGSNLGADSLAQIEAVVSACLNEDVMNFDFNSHLLPAEIEKKMADGQSKVLDIGWSPITDDAGTVMRLMLCIRDVTELRVLAAEANKQKRELEIIGEILSVTQEKFHAFIVNAMKFINENELLIRKNASHNPDALAMMFRNMHTIKGNARTYGLSYLTNIVHEVEMTYVDLREPRPAISWDQTTLMNELFAVKDMVEYYAKINEVSLGRKGPGRRGSVEHFLMVDKVQIAETIRLLEEARTGNLAELRSAHNAVRLTLRLLGTERIVETLEEAFGSLPSLAQELGKLPPIVEIRDNGFVVHNQASGMLKNVFMHLLRNTMDHGLETPEERSLHNKPLAGTISLHMDVQDGLLQIRLADDGRGLALSHIRKIAAEKALIDADQPLSDEDIAGLIFRPGFSTAEAVTEVSGRGVGMDAVRDFVRRENGTIEIRFTDNRLGADFRQFEIVLRLPEMLAENVGDFELQPQHEFDDELIEFESPETSAIKQA